MAAADVIVDEHPAARAAALVADHVRAAIAARGRATLAVSGGSTAPPMLDALAAADDLDWALVDVFQVDERVAADGDPDRNAGQLAAFPGNHHLMPVTAADLEAAAADYAALLPDRFDVVHLGIGPDGHTASWPPGDPVIDRPEPVAVSGEYQGRVRMTLTPPVIDAALARVVLVVGTDKADAIGRWIGGVGDASSLPVDRVPTTDTTVVLDAAAAARLPGRS